MARLQKSTGKTWRLPVEVVVVVLPIGGHRRPRRQRRMMMPEGCDFGSGSGLGQPEFAGMNLSSATLKLDYSASHAAGYLSPNPMSRQLPAYYPSHSCRPRC
uniref:(northern house mosquito) hypothetical protein n=1 Tax=Culex pipiens TaxID=7175 RepID=A0A8D8AMW1_CULPI